MLCGTWNFIGPNENFTAMRLDCTVQPSSEFRRLMQFRISSKTICRHSTIQSFIFIPNLMMISFLFINIFFAVYILIYMKNVLNSFMNLDGRL